MTPLLSRTILFIALAGVACLVNVPLGSLRSQQRKFSAKWFIFVHLSIPLIYLLRTKEGFGYWAIPPLVASAVAGQIIGGKMRRPSVVTPSSLPNLQDQDQIYKGTGKQTL